MIGALSLVALIGGFLFGATMGWFFGADRSTARIIAAINERIRREREAEEVRTPEPVGGESMPTRQEVRDAAIRGAAAAPEVRFWLCHAPRCPGNGQHRCHDLDCRAHAAKNAGAKS